LPAESARPRLAHAISTDPEEQTVLSSYADFVIKGDPEGVRSIGDQVISGAGFTIAWENPATGHAQRGSLPLTILLGAFAGKKRQLVKVDLAIFTGPQPGTAVVRLTRVSSGWVGGAIGATRNNKIFEDLIRDLGTRFGQAGSLLGINKG
jgi:hypothetical protein